MNGHQRIRRHSCADELVTLKEVNSESNIGASLKRKTKNTDAGHSPKDPCTRRTDCHSKCTNIAIDPANPTAGNPQNSCFAHARMEVSGLLADSISAQTVDTHTSAWSKFQKKSKLRKNKHTEDINSSSSRSSSDSSSGDRGSSRSSISGRGSSNSSSGNGCSSRSNSGRSKISSSSAAAAAVEAAAVAAELVGAGG